MLHRVKKVLQYGPQRWNEVQTAMEVQESILEPEASSLTSSLNLVFHLDQSLNVWKVKKVEYGISWSMVSWSAKVCLLCWKSILKHVWPMKVYLKNFGVFFEKVDFYHRLLDFWTFNGALPGGLESRDRSQNFGNKYIYISLYLINDNQSEQ